MADDGGTRRLAEPVSDTARPRLPAPSDKLTRQAGDAPARRLPYGVNLALHGEAPMAACSTSPVARTGYELRFESLLHPGRALAFPCDEHGRVELDALSDAARRNYLYARAVVGREFASPALVLNE